MHVMHMSCSRCSRKGVGDYGACCACLQDMNWKQPPSVLDSAVLLLRHCNVTTVVKRYSVLLRANAAVWLSGDPFTLHVHSCCLSSMLR